MSFLRNRVPSLAGRRVALNRKFGLNTEHYGGNVKLLTVTPAGSDLCPFGDEVKKIGYEDVKQVEGIYRSVWNATAQARMSRLFEAAQKAADRFVASQGWKGKPPRQIGNVRSTQKRGVYHFHYQLPFTTPVEIMWSRCVHRFIDNAWRQDQARWPDEQERRDLIWREYIGLGTTRGFYGFGFVNGGNPAGRSAAHSAQYMGRNAAARYMVGNVINGGRHYVNAELTRATGVTMRALRACNWLYVRRKLIAAGELEDSWVPSHWDPEWSAKVLNVWNLCNPAQAP